MAMFVSIIPLSPRFSRSSWCLITVSFRNFMLWGLVLMWTVDCCTRPSIRTSLKYWSFYYFLTNHSVLSFLKTYIIYFLCSWTTWGWEKVLISFTRWTCQDAHNSCLFLTTESWCRMWQPGWVQISQESALCLIVPGCKCVLWNSRLQSEMSRPPVPVTRPPLCHRGPLSLWNKPSH